jgi:hypothetical protein
MQSSVAAGRGGDGLDQHPSGFRRLRIRHESLPSSKGETHPLLQSESGNASCAHAMSLIRHAEHSAKARGKEYAARTVAGRTKATASLP